MGNIISFLFRQRVKVDVLPADLGPEADIQDPKTFMTPRQVAYVHMTWNFIQQDLKTHGLNFFILLFKTYPFVQSRFKGFSGKSIEELKKSHRLKGHGTTVMTAFDSYISNLDDLSVVSEMLQVTGVNHKSRGVKKTDLQLVVPVMLQYLRDSVGTSWSSEAEEAWSQLLKLFLSLIVSAFNTYDDDE